MNARTLPPLALAIVLATGCTAQRRITITSDPPGARAWLNDVEIGRTPASAAFKFYGAYDVRLELDGYEPLHEVRNAKAPIWEFPGLDLVALAVPGRKQVEIDWHFSMAPTIESSQAPQTVESELLSRARLMRERLADGSRGTPIDPAVPPPAEAGTPTETPAQTPTEPSTPPAAH